jgi:flagellin-like protein
VKKSKMRNFRRSKKALSPVIASIILIAVTVAVSLAVATWMGSLTIGLMVTEQLQITSVGFPSGGTVTVALKNLGTNPITITAVHINNGENLLSSSVTLPANGDTTQSVSYDWATGNSYQAEIMTAKGNKFMYNVFAP